MENTAISHPLLADLDERAQLVLRVLIERHLEAGEAIGSRTLARSRVLDLSPASIRNVMADLEALGLLYAPHTSAGRLPTELGLRLFVNGLMEAREIDGERDKAVVFSGLASDQAASPNDLLDRASSLLRSLRGCASVVVAPTSREPIKHIEFVPLSSDQALVVLVRSSGQVENRVIPIPRGLPSDALTRANAYCAHRMQTHTLPDALARIREDLSAQRAELDALTAELVQAGIAVSQDPQNTAPLFVVRGASQLLDDVKAMEDLERVRHLMDALETRETLLKLLNEAEGADGIQIFIGSDTQLFGLSGCSMILAPSRGEGSALVGMVGVIGPLHMNYGRVVPVVDYTAQLVSRLMGSRSQETEA